MRRELTMLCVGFCVAHFVVVAPLSGAAREPGPDPAAALESAMAAAEERLHAGDTAAAQAGYGAAIVQGQRLLAKSRSAEADADGAARALDAAAAAAAADDPETTFLVATDFLWLKRIDAAERLFAELERQRPGPETRVLIGHAYRDAGEYLRARAELEAALAQDPGVHRAHYYLGTVILADPGTGPGRSDEAIAEFQAEVKLAPEDALSWDQLGAALLDADRPAEALSAIERAVGIEARVVYAYHLGRCQLALERPTEAVSATRRALALAQEQGATESELERIQYQLGIALRKSGASQDAATHLAEAKRIAARWTAASPTESTPASPSISELSASQRRELERRVTSSLARAYLNLGVLQAQAEHLADAIGLFERAAAADADFPQVQYSLGVALFTAKQFDKATDPLTRALAAAPGDLRLRRMLAMACLDSQAYAKAAELLQDDPQRTSDPSLQFAYGLALARGGRGADAEAIFTQLIREQGESPELDQALREARARH